MIECVEYSIDNLKEIIKSETDCLEYQLEHKKHIPYFRTYFEKLDAKTIVVEKNYIDKDYLEDYSSYYVRSFNEYKRFCTRLHFFSIAFNKEEFVSLLNNTNYPSEHLSIDDFKNKYIGFVVLKPLPYTIIGRTCLKTYPINEKRFFPVIRNYDVNLVGITLNVNSIAYQEQDGTVSACATSALWSVFQTTALMFQHPIPSPVKITKSAIKFFPYSNRHFPNKGLTPEQMAHAIRNVDLEPFLINANNYSILKATIYAYLKAKIPLILGIDLIDTTNDMSMGRHAVNITGYRNSENLEKFDGEKFYLSSSRIEKIYVHDDQIGPFARMEFNRTDNCLTTTWNDNRGNIGNVKGKPEIVIIPLYHKIRIPFEVILKLTYQLDLIIKKIDDNFNLGLNAIEWDIHLISNNDYKSEIINSTLKKDLKIQSLLSRFPKYIWKVSAISGDEKLDLIFDTTDIEQGKIFIQTIPFSEYLYNLFKLIAKQINLDGLELQLKEVFDKIASS